MNRANELIEAGYKLKLTAKHMLLLAIGKVSPEWKTQKRPITITAEQMIEIFDICRAKGINSDMRAAANELTSAVVNIMEAGSIRYTHWCSEANYIQRESKVELWFSPYVFKRITNLREGNFTSIVLSVLVPLRGLYSIRLFELLMERRDKGTRVIKVEELRRMLQTEDNPGYAEYKAFHRCVIKRAIAEINEKSIYNVTFEPIKEKRVVTALRFKFSVKPGEFDPIYLLPSTRETDPKDKAILQDYLESTEALPLDTISEEAFSDV